MRELSPQEVQAMAASTVKNVTILQKITELPEMGGLIVEPEDYPFKSPIAPWIRYHCAPGRALAGMRIKVRKVDEGALVVKLSAKKDG